jgi:aminoglycoside phosphotransferase (APT) family kinase protein
MKKSWTSDVELNDEKVKSIVQTALPRIQFTTFRKLDEGWDNALYLFDEDIIVRFCKRKIVIPFMQVEIKALQWISNHIQFPLPRIIDTGVFDNEYPFFSYNMLPGTIVANLNLNEEERAALVEPMATYMRQLHTLPVTAEIQSMLPGDLIGRLDIAKRTQQIKDKLLVISQLGVDFDTTVPEALFKLVSQHQVANRQCIVHGDLHSRNILVQHRSRISGIIDWGDIHIGNPAKDLAFAVSFFAPETLRQFISLYKLFDPVLFNLALFSATNLTLYLSEYALDIQDEALINECRRSFENIEKNFAAGFGSGS